MKVSQRSQNVKTSPTLALAAKAIELKDQGVDVISLSVGEPDWETFPVCKEAGLKAIQENKTKYTPASGSASLKKALVKDFMNRHKIEIKPSQVVISPGAKYAIQQAIWNLINPGEKVGIFVPYWASYTTMVEIADGVPVLISMNADGSLIKEEVERVIQEGVTLLLLNSPNNPSGSALSKKDYEVLADIMKSHPQVQLIMDDIYSHLYWGEEEHCPHLFDVAPELFERTLVISGASKAFSMTGWRIGWAIGSESIIKGISKMQSQTTGCPCSISQEATCAGVEKAQENIQDSLKVLKVRAEKGYKLLSEIEGAHLQKPESAFYFWLDLSEVLKKHQMNDSEFCAQLLESEAVVIVPGSDFGVPNYVRLSFAVHEDTLAEGVRRIQKFIASL